MVAGIVPSRIVRLVCSCLFSVAMSIDEEKPPVSMIDTNFRIMSWNVQGLNSPTKRSTVFVVSHVNRISILNLQETKIESWST